MKEKEDKALLSMTIEQIQHATHLAKVGLHNYSGIVRDILELDHSLSSEDVESELLFTVLSLIRENGVEILDSYKIVTDSERNHLYDMLRKLKAKKRSSEKVSSLEDEMERGLDAGGLTEDGIVDGIQIKAVFNSMGPKDQETFVLLFLRELPQKEAAEMLGVTQAAVAQRKKKIIRMFRDGDSCR